MSIRFSRGTPFGAFTIITGRIMIQWVNNKITLFERKLATIVQPSYIVVQPPCVQRSVTMCAPPFDTQPIEKVIAVF